MRPNTTESGIFKTNRNRPVSTNMLTRMLVPKPKKAFQSVAVHSTGLRVIAVMARCLRCSLSSKSSGTEANGSVHGLPGDDQTCETSASATRSSKSHGSEAHAEAHRTEKDVLLRIE